MHYASNTRTDSLGTGESTGDGTPALHAADQNSLTSTTFGSLCPARSDSYEVLLGGGGGREEVRLLVKCKPPKIFNMMIHSKVWLQRKSSFPYFHLLQKAMSFKLNTIYWLCQTVLATIN